MVNKQVTKEKKTQQFEFPNFLYALIVFLGVFSTNSIFSKREIT